MPCSDTANGSAKTACSSVIESGTLNSIESCAGISSPKPPGTSLHMPVWMPGARSPFANDQHWLRSPAAHAGQIGVDAARLAREPRVQHDAVPDLEPFGLRPERDHVGHHLVAHHVRERHEVLHRVVLVVARAAVLRREARVVEEDLLRLRAADAGEPRLRHHPVRAEKSRIVHLDQLHRRPGQRPEQSVVGVRLGLGFGLDPEDQCAHALRV